MKKMLMLVLLLTLILYAHAEALPDGLYTASVESSSSMFRVTRCVLMVQDGVIHARMTLGGTGYGYLFPGTAEQADIADRMEWIPYVEDANGAYTFTLPIVALGKEIPVAAWSKKYEKWYDRTLVVSAGNSMVIVPKDGQYTAFGRIDGETAAFTLTVTEDSLRFKAEALAGNIASLDCASTVDGHSVFIDSQTLEPVESALSDGLYAISVESNSKLFPVCSCTLMAQDGAFTLVLTVSDQKNDALFMGKASDARRAETNQLIRASFNADGTTTFRLPIEAPETEISLAVHAARNDKWYDRSLMLDLHILNVD